MNRVVRLMQCGFKTTFVLGGEVRDLTEPEGPPTGRQLVKLNELGLLAVVESQMSPLTKGEAAWLLDRALEEEA